jgi:hypothetical protein
MCEVSARRKNHAATAIYHCQSFLKLERITRKFLTAPTVAVSYIIYMFLYETIVNYQGSPCQPI